jgi:GR25 family glycosyltransferase involved in LPS biosynthesis
MRLDATGGALQRSLFRFWRSAVVAVPGGRIAAFGPGPGRIGSVIVLNLDRQVGRWRRVSKELGRFQTSEGEPLQSITRRLSAIDARDGRSTAPTVDVDVVYRIGHQLHVQPDARLAECFATDEPIRMTRQEVAVARSHVECWKTVASGPDDHVLILEDDIWFRPGAAAAIDCGWRAALGRCRARVGPGLLYLSYADAGGTADRADACPDVFRPVRGLWFLSGYVLSREGAAALLRALPVVGPADLWMNYRFAELGALALAEPALSQRPDETSGNAYSVLPYLARAGIVDAPSHESPRDPWRARPVLAWTAGGEHEGLAMALSMLGLRVRAFDGDEEPLDEQQLREAFGTFDALVDPPLYPASLSAASADGRSVLIVETGAPARLGFEPDLLRVLAAASVVPSTGSWDELCSVLGLVRPVDAYPMGAPRGARLFRGDRPTGLSSLRDARRLRADSPHDDSPWVLPHLTGWQPAPITAQPEHSPGRPMAVASLTGPSPWFGAAAGTFPGNLASFERSGPSYDAEGARLVLDEGAGGGPRPYRSHALASLRPFEHGRFEADIKPPTGPGLITGFFLHRDEPRQEIDVEFIGGQPGRMLVNVFFNPGDDGATLGFGYRGSPCWVDLGFDSTTDWHRYAIDWRPDRVTWLVDGEAVHERLNWDPTPLPHLPMRLHANLWTPRSEEFTGPLKRSSLPAEAFFRNVSVMA